MGSRNKVQVGTTNRWRKTAEPWRVTGRLLFVFFLLSRLGQGADRGFLDRGERDGSPTATPQSKEQGGFPAQDTVSVIDPSPQKEGRSLLSVLGKTNIELNSERATISHCGGQGRRDLLLPS
ncbi:hypothetical protein D9C73_000006 [Collichthys lucidus]|uniref:Uncharacterized protein n=1 Tax=Collichthys lucidus TaxID=240159 RepID=A0A4U5TWV0_COLLU|nr:hypothetical protein D9C73_000006 [Collichthys lucidus]